MQLIDLVACFVNYVSGCFDVFVQFVSLLFGVCSLGVGCRWFVTVGLFGCCSLFVLLCGCVAGLVFGGCLCGFVCWLDVDGRCVRV